jgi:tRNA (uracil-5-)-methyltransferase
MTSFSVFTLQLLRYPWQGDINEKCLAWLRECCASITAERECECPGTGATLLELYCGGGNHTVALATMFTRAVAVELDPRLVELARFNLERNGVRNAIVHRLASGEFCDRTLVGRSFSSGGNGDGGNGVGSVVTESSLSSASTFSSADERHERTLSAHAAAAFDVVLLDPPRAGLDARTLELVAGVDHVLMISCNQTELERTLQTLCGSHEEGAGGGGGCTSTHTVRRFAFFDHFPFTAHTEVAVWLTRRVDSGHGDSAIP